MLYLWFSICMHSRGAGKNFFINFTVRISKGTFPLLQTNLPLSHGVHPRYLFLLLQSFKVVLHTQRRVQGREKVPLYNPYSDINIGKKDINSTKRGKNLPSHMWLQPYDEPHKSAVFFLFFYLYVPVCQEFSLSGLTILHYAHKRGVRVSNFGI